MGFDGTSTWTKLTRPRSHQHRVKGVHQGSVFTTHATAREQFELQGGRGGVKLTLLCRSKYILNIWNFDLINIPNWSDLCEGLVLGNGIIFICSTVQLTRPDRHVCCCDKTSWKKKKKKSCLMNWSFQKLIKEPDDDVSFLLSSVGNSSKHIHQVAVVSSVFIYGQASEMFPKPNKSRSNKTQKTNEKS